jgi:hypothetical protein
MEDNSTASLAMAYHVIRFFPDCEKLKVLSSLANESDADSEYDRLSEKHPHCYFDVLNDEELAESLPA